MVNQDGGNLTQALQRELDEEIGARAIPSSLAVVDAWADLGRPHDPRADRDYNRVVVAYMGELAALPREE